MEEKINSTPILGCVPLLDKKKNKIVWETTDHAVAEMVIYKDRKTLRIGDIIELEDARVKIVDIVANLFEFREPGIGVNFAIRGKEFPNNASVIFITEEI